MEDGTFHSHSGVWNKTQHDKVKNVPNMKQQSLKPEFVDLQEPFLLYELNESNIELL